MYRIFWFRRDLRLEDNAGLYHALKAGLPVIPVFIFDRNILDKLEDRDDHRVAFIHQTLASLKEQLTALGSDLWVLEGDPLVLYKQLVTQVEISGVFTNHDYEPYALERDRQIGEFLAGKGVGFHTFKDQVIFEKQEILSNAQSIYTVFTPYSRKWKAACNDFYLSSYPVEKYHHVFARRESAAFLFPPEFPSLEALGFQDPGIEFPGADIHETMIRQYQEKRNYPAVAGTSRLSVHLRFGTISIRQLAKKAGLLGETFLNELIWRDFYMMILANFPEVVSHAFKKAYDHIPWRNDEKEFTRWMEGQTGYPIVDAGMRELNATGFMHNRVRMITASFLTKHLLIDWRWGEAYFARKLLDFDLAANNGGWQWAAGSGCDAAPYFRIFNPSEQTRKFDPQLDYTRKWVPEFESLLYPKPMVDHKMARERALQTYKKALAQWNG